MARHKSWFTGRDTTSIDEKKIEGETETKVRYTNSETKGNVCFIFSFGQGYKLTSTTGIGCLTNTKKLIQMYEYKFTSTFVIGFVTITITIKTNDVREVTSYFFLLYNYFLHCLFHVATVFNIVHLTLLCTIKSTVSKSVFGIVESTV